MAKQNVANNPIGSYPVKVTNLDNSEGQLQHVRLDVGVGNAESAVSTANPMPVTVISGGGGDATAANQVLEIAELTTLNANTSTAANQTLEIAELTALNAAAATSQATLDVLVTQSELMADLVATMKLIRKTLEPLATQDSVQRQRVVVESITGINSQVGAANITQINTLVGGQNPPGQGTGVVQTVWEAPVEQRWRVMDAARLNAYLQRQNLTFS